MKKTIIITTLLLGMFFCWESVIASETNLLQPASDIIYNENLIVNGYGKFASVRIGEEGIGGVTYFNGTIINIGEAVPVTFGDDVRIDGEIWRGVSKGTSDGMPLKISDTAIPTTTNVNDLGSATNRWKKIYAKDGDFGGNLYIADTLTVNAVEGLDDTDIPNDITVSKYLPLSGGTLSGELKSPEFSYNSAKTFYQGINGFACTGVNIDYMDNFVCRGGSAATIMRAHWNLDLSDGAEIKKITAIFYDNDPAKHISCSLLRHNYDLSYSQMASVTTQPLSPSTSAQPVSTSTITYPVIDYENHNYRISCSSSGTIPSNLGVESFKIEYSKSSPD